MLRVLRKHLVFLAPHAEASSGPGRGYAGGGHTTNGCGASRIASRIGLALSECFRSKSRQLWSLDEGLAIPLDRRRAEMSR